MSWFKNLASQSLFLALFFSPLMIASCSGGGSGGDGGGKEGRTTDSAVRIIHSSVDAVPLGVAANGVFLGQSSYLGENKFYKVGTGPNSLSISRAARINEVVETLPLTVEDKVEYTIFAYGAEKDQQFNIKILKEPVVRPEAGSARIQVLNGVSDLSGIKFTIGSIVANPVNFGESSGFFDLPSGVYDVTITGPTGSPLGVVAVNLGDRGRSYHRGFRQD